jgi:FAD/FMN-containing dehydrogenase
MPCPSKVVAKAPGVWVSDLYQLHAFRARVEFKPRTKAELVAATVISARESRSLRAIGTNWSLSRAGVAQNVVCTDSLNLHVGPPFSPGTPPLPAQRLRDGGSDFVVRVCSGEPRATGRRFVHVEAGIKIHELLDDLGKCGLALPTMGSSAGQSLAGALSTGTHGADFEIPPLVEWIQALHVVGSGGQEWWITPESSIFADERLLKLQAWCSDARIVANNEAFDAVRVAVGRMGVIYSMILEVQPAYSLVEVNLQHAWSEIRGQLEQSVAGLKRGVNTGIFEAPLSGLESGWFRSELLGRTEETFPHHKFRYVDGPRRRQAPLPSPSTDNRYRDMLRDLGLENLASDLRGGAARKLLSANIAVNLADPAQCWVKRRWRLPGRVRSLLPSSGKIEPIVKAVIDNKENPEGMTEPLRGQVDPGFWLDLLLFLEGIFHGPRARRFDRFKTEDIPRIAKSSNMSGEALILTMYKLATDPILGGGARNEVVSRFSKFVGAEFSDLARAGLATDLLNKPTPDSPSTAGQCTPRVYRLDGALSINSAEFFFDASSPVYLNFIDRVIALATAHAPVFGVMGIRFTPRATALIAMQRFPRTVSIEVGTGRAHQDEVYREFWNAVYKAANERRAIPHWGQEFRQSSDAIAAHYRERLLTWRRMLAELSIDAPDTFSTEFSQKHGLEPTEEATGTFDSESTELFLAGLEAAAD